MPSTFESIFKSNHVDLRVAALKSKTWFEQQARLLSQKTIPPQLLIRSNPELNGPKILPGSMYLFRYDPLHKDTLPFYDAYPLIFPFKKLPDGMIGLNFHYIPYQWRIKLLDKLMSVKTSTTLDENTKLKFSWSTISGLSTMQIAQPCVHRYLINQVKSPFKKIDANDWATALMLPVERFVGSSKQNVWKDSLK